MGHSSLNPGKLGTPGRGLMAKGLRERVETWEQTLHGCPWRTTKGAAPCAVKVARTVLNGGFDMKSFQSLLCSTFGHDTTRCPISGILRRCAGRQRLVQSLRTMNPQSSD